MELSLDRLEIFRRIGKRLDRKIQKVGLQPAMVALLRKINAQLIIEKEGEVVDWALTRDPVIIVSNHPGESDVITLVAALNDRPDINMIIDSSFLKLLPHLDKHLIPVYVNHHDGEESRGFYKGMIFRKFHPNQTFTKKIAHQKNIDSINLAAKKVGQGELVIMFPGAGKFDGKWFDGIGFLLNGIKPKPGTKIIMAHIDGASDWDYFKVLPLVGKLLKPITIHFSVPLKFEKVLQKSPSETTRYLEKIYQTWVNKSTWHHQN